MDLNLIQASLPRNINVRQISRWGWWIEKAYDTLLLDARSTLLQLAKLVEQTYATIGSKYGSKNRIRKGKKRKKRRRKIEEMRL
ncbi:hypothetical protein CMV_020871 [Castanea mollissima]|uniref:Uncharacterized protein n=1 Tax=Castanea mollissima TaxID=60419 RepID=A0A8J4VM90_9ROSI|nr:hypothetical protein CMV_020871 [Castanea mollissima]